MTTEHLDLEELADLQLPAVTSPYAGKKLKTSQQLTISAYWFATNFLWGALLTIMLPGEIKDLAPHYRVSALGLLTGLSAFVALFVPLIVGALSDRCVHPWGRRRPYIAVGVAVNMVGLGLMALAYGTASPILSRPSKGHGLIETVQVLLTSPTFTLFLAAYLIVQLGNNIASAAYSGVIPDLVPEDQHGSASGYMALMSQIGTLFGAVFCGVLLGGQPEGVKYAVLAAVLGLVAAVTVLGIKENPLPERPPKIVWGSYLRSLWIDPRKYPDFAWVWITRALVMLGFYAILPFINYYLIDVIGIEKPEDAASKLIGVILIFSAISGVAGGYISDRIGRKRVVYIANAVIAVMTLTFIFCRSINEVMLAGVVFGLGFGAYTSVDWALGTDVLPSKKNAAKEMAVWHVAMTLPQSIAAPFAGFIIAQFGETTLLVKGKEVVHYTVPGYSTVFALSAVCFALGAYLLRNVRGVR